MNAQDCTARWKRIVADHLQIDESRIEDRSDFYGDLWADSLDTIELLMAAEEEFGIEITDDEAEEVITFGDSVILIKGKLG